jgi:hypothetical protein
LFCLLSTVSHVAVDIPAEVDNYRHLVLLETAPTSTPAPKSNIFGYATSVYKAVNSKDGLTYCLKRLHGMLSSNLLVMHRTSGDFVFKQAVKSRMCVRTFDRFSPVRHAGVVCHGRVEEAATCQHR